MLLFVERALKLYFTAHRVNPLKSLAAREDLLTKGTYGEIDRARNNNEFID